MHRLPIRNPTRDTPALHFGMNHASCGTARDGSSPAQLPAPLPVRHNRMATTLAMGQYAAITVADRANTQ